LRFTRTKLGIELTELSVAFSELSLSLIELCGERRGQITQLLCVHLSPLTRQLHGPRCCHICRDSYTLRSTFFLQHADLRALIEPLPGQADHQRLQLFVRKRQTSLTRRTGAYKTPLVESSCTQPQAKAIVHQHLHPVRTLVDEQIRMMGA